MEKGALREWSLKSVEIPRIHTKILWCKPHDLLTSPTSANIYLQLIIPQIHVTFYISVKSVLLLVMPSMHRCRPFGVTSGGHQASLYTLVSPSVEVDVTDYGATVVAIRCLDRYGRMDDIVAGYPSVEGYELNSTGLQNEQSHSGDCGAPTPCSFNKVLFSAEPNGNKSVKFEASTTKDKDGGNLGKVSLTVKYDLRGSELHVRYTGSSDYEAVVYLSNRTYFNLSGKDVRRDLRSHIITVHSDMYMKGTDDKPKPVKNTQFDVRKPTLLTRAVASTMRDVFDGGTLYNFAKGGSRKSVAKIEQVDKGRIVTIETTQSLVDVNTMDRCAIQTAKLGVPSEPGVFFSVMPTSPSRLSHKNFKYPLFTLEEGSTQTYSVWFSFTHTL